MTSPDLTTPAPRRRRLRLTVVAAAVLTVVAAAGIAVTFALKPTGPQAAIPACRDQVLAQLRTPATARFRGETVEESQTQSTVVGVFDAQNSHGALTRYSYRCMLLPDSGGRYRIADVTVS